MKKLVIAGASVALAAMPVLGAFAETSSTEFTDNLSVDVSAGCTMENGGNTDGDYTNRYFSKAIATGNFAVLEAVADTDSGTTQAESAGGITIKCNTSSGTVTVKAVAANSGQLLDGSNYINPGAQTNGSNSGWAIKSNNTGATQNPYADYKAYAVDDNQTFSTFLQAQASTAGIAFNPSYRVYVAQGQLPGTYTGSVTYTISYAGA